MPFAAPRGNTAAFASQWPFPDLLPERRMTDSSSHPAIRRVAIVGAGTIGASWAALFLAHGLEVVVSDPAADAESQTLSLIHI